MQTREADGEKQYRRVPFNLQFVTRGTRLGNKTGNLHQSRISPVKNGVRLFNVRSGFCVRDKNIEASAFSLPPSRTIFGIIRDTECTCEIEAHTGQCMHRIIVFD